MTDQVFIVSGLNPEQWESPGKDRFGGTAKSTALTNYQRAVAADLKRDYPDHEQIDGPCEIVFYIWRQLVTYEGERKRVRKNRVDATNVQKALEDAIQGVLIKNDREVLDVRTRIVEQATETEPFIIIVIREPRPVDPEVLALRRDFLVERDKPRPAFRDIKVEDVF